MPITYITGDATLPPRTNEPKIIAHVVNDRGGWGRGFVGALSARYPGPERWYRAWAKGRHPESGEFALGSIQEVQVMDNLVVVNLLAQHGYFGPQNPVPFDYGALRRCLQKLCSVALRNSASVHMPRIGAGLAKGDWSIIEAVITVELVNQGVNVTVYDVN